MKATRWALMLALVSGCGAATPSGQFLYVSNLRSGDVSAYLVDQATGALNALPGSPFAIGGLANQHLALHPTGRFGFLHAGPQLHAFTVDRSGNLVEHDPYRSGSLAFGTPNDIVHHPSGQFLYTAARGGVLSFEVDARTGELEQTATVATGTAGQPVDLAIAPSGDFLYLLEQRLGQIYGFGLDQTTGMPSPLSGFPMRLPPRTRHLGVEPRGQFVYALSTGSDGRDWVTIYSLASQSGALSPVTGSPVAIDPGASSLVFHPTADFLYVPNRQYGVLAYRLRSTGGLDRVPDSPSPAGQRASSGAFDPMGRFLYVVNVGSDNVSAFAVDQMTGALREVPGSPFSAGDAPQFVAITAVP